MDGALVKKAGKEQPEKVMGNRCDGRFGRKIFAIKMIDATEFGVGDKQSIGDLRHGDIHGLKYRAKGTGRQIPCGLSGGGGDGRAEGGGKELRHRGAILLNR